MTKHQNDERPLHSWLRPLTRGAGPRYQQIVELLAQAIESGQLLPGDQVPPQRALAAALDVDLTTVTRAYTEARNRGLIASFSGKGSFVSQSRRAPASTDIDLGMNVPPLPAAGLEQWVSDATAELFRQDKGRSLSLYDVGPLSPSALQASQAWLRPALGSLVEQELLQSAGAQAAIHAILSTHTQAGDTVLCEALSYPGFLLAARTLGLNVQTVPCDEDGIRPDALEALARSSKARVLYLNPTVQNPTTHTLPLARREALARTLSKLELVLLEDDPYWFLVNDAPPPLLSLTGGLRSYYVSSLSKCLWPGLRTAFILAPSDEARHQVQDKLHACGMGGSSLLSGMAEQWIRSGVAQQLQTEVQREARARQTLARSLLPRNAQAHPCGLHIWLPLPAPWTAETLASALEPRGITIASADAFAASPEVPSAIRLSIGGASSQAELAKALKEIGTLLQDVHARKTRQIV